MAGTGNISADPTPYVFSIFVAMENPEKGASTGRQPASNALVGR